MESRINEAIDALNKEIVSVNDLEGIKQIRAKYTTKSEILSELKEQVKTADNKAEIGRLINLYNTQVNGIINSKKEELENKFDLEERENPILNQEGVTPSEGKGVLHPLTKITNIVMSFLDELGFEYAHGLEIEDEEINFDKLNIPKNHPARTMQDTFFLEGHGKLLRTHSTNITARHLAETKNKNLKAYSIGTVFRNDENDATHSFQFNQIDLFRIGKQISVADLKWIIDELLKRIFEDELEVRYRPSYFPFTEPSFEVDIKRKEDKDWIEVLGCGMIHSNVIKNAGKNPLHTQGYAAGLGLERLAMLKYGITDIRNFYENDVEFLKEVDNEN